MKETADKIKNWLKDYLYSANKKAFIVGVSGGIDSGLVSTLCALTNEKTIIVSMPILQNKNQLIRANNHIKWLKEKFSNVVSYEYDLTDIFITYEKLFSLQNKHASANTRSRLRMTTLYHIAGLYDGIVVGTGNKVEDFGVGFFTKYGDGGVDISPIGDLFKSEVKAMAKGLGLLDEIVNAIPTDGLWDDSRSDEDQIGATYDELEWAMQYDGSDTINDRQKKVLKIYNTFNNNNKHKMLPIPIFKK